MAQLCATLGRDLQGKQNNQMHIETPYFAHLLVKVCQQKDGELYQGSQGTAKLKAVANRLLNSTFDSVAFPVHVIVNGLNASLPTYSNIDQAGNHWVVVVISRSDC